MTGVFLRSHYQSVWHPVNNLRQFCRHVKWSVQRIHKGYSDYDCGDIDIWFLAVIPDMLETYEKSLLTWENEYGEAGQHPTDFRLQFYRAHQGEMDCSLDEFYGSRDPRIDEWRRRADAECYQKWRGILKEMAFLFREADRDDFDESSPFDSQGNLAEEDRYRDECRKKAFALFTEWFCYLWN